MKKNILMTLGFAVVFATGVACFLPSSKKDGTSPIHTATNSVAAPAAPR